MVHWPCGHICCTDSKIRGTYSLALKGFVVAIQLPSHVWLFVTPWTATQQAPLTFTISGVCSNSLSIESETLSNHFILYHTLSFSLHSFPASWSFLKSWLFTSCGQSIGATASASVLPMNIQGWFPLGLAGLISLLCKGPSRVFSGTTIQKLQFFNTQSSLWSSSHICTWLLEKPELWP